MAALYTPLRAEPLDDGQEVRRQRRAQHTCSPVTGCSKPSVAACSNRRGESIHRPGRSRGCRRARRRAGGRPRPGGCGSGASCRSRAGPRTASRRAARAATATWVTARLPWSRGSSIRADHRRDSARGTTRSSAPRPRRARRRGTALHRVRAQLRGHADLGALGLREREQPVVARSMRCTTCSGTVVAGLPIRRHAPRIRSIAVPVSRSSYGTLLIAAGLSITRRARRRTPARPRARDRAAAVPPCAARPAGRSRAGDRSP